MFEKICAGLKVASVGILAAILLFTAGCATIGREFPVDRISRIEVGETTREEMEHLFGQPWRTGIEDGDLTWTYACYRLKLFGASSTKDLFVRFDSRGVVASYSFNTTDQTSFPRE